MATTTLGVLNYTIPNLKLKNQLKDENNIVNINDQLMDQIVVTKKSKVNQTTSLPTQIVTTSQSNDIKSVLGTIVMNQQTNQQIVQPTKKRRVSDGSSSGKTKQPQAVSVARRNARERNRVKQVNNGFAALREHIPEEIAETYETAARGSAKKLSKVETLRMAVEYIRVLENMLNIDSSKDTSFNNTSVFSNFSSNMSEASLPATPPPDQPIFYAIKPRQMSSNDDLGGSETQITIINGHQYLRIPGTNTFQLITPNDHFENEENVHPRDEFVQTNFMQTPIQFGNQLSETPSPSHTSTTSNNLLDSSSSLNFININNSNNSSTTTTAMQETPLRIITPAGSISPSTYSGHSSLSPATSQIDNINNNIIMKEPKFEIISATGHELENNDYKSIHFANNIIMVSESHNSNNDNHYQNIILKEEIDDESMFDDGTLNNQMLEAVSWYQQQLIQNNNQNHSP